jgi:hypothetical protein
MLIFNENKHGKTGNEKSLAGAKTISKEKIHLRTSETTSNSSAGQAGETVIKLSVNENKHKKLKQKL